MRPPHPSQPALLRSAARPGAAVLLCLAAASRMMATPADLAPEDPDLDVFEAIEVQFQTCPGRLYEIQGSENLANYTTIGDAIYGDGLSRQLFYSTREHVVGYHYYRLKMSDPPEVGSAPLTLTGSSLAFNDGTATRTLSFGDPATPFEWKYTKIGANSATLALTGPGAGVEEIWSLTFAGQSTGSFTRRTTVNGTLTATAAGSFSPAAVAPAASPVPALLTGLRLTLSENGKAQLLDFTSATTGSRSKKDEHDATTRPFTFTWTPAASGPSRLVLSYGDERLDSCSLTFTTSTSGRFVREEFRHGNLRDSDHGTFSLSTPAVPVPASGAAVPASPAGLTLRFTDGGTPTLISLTSATTGTRRRDGGPTTIQYTWQPSGPSTATLGVTTSSGKYSVYNLDFATSAFTRLKYEDGSLDSTDQGTFQILP